MTATPQRVQDPSIRELIDLPEECISINEAHAASHAYIACAFYTPNYLPQVSALKRSLDAHGISYFLKRYEKQPTWEEGTRLKPVFLSYCLEKFPDNDILYLDADAVVRKPLEFFDQVTADVSFLLTPKRKHNRNYLRLTAATVLIRKTPGGRRFVETWKTAGSGAAKLMHDEDLLHRIFPKLAGISVALLPTSYSKIFDESGEDTAIEQFQASRGQFKPSYALRKTRRIALIVAAMAALGLAAWTAMS